MLSLFLDVLVILSLKKLIHLPRYAKQERDLKQKRLLIEDYRRKQGEADQILSSKDDKIVWLLIFTLFLASYNFLL